MAELESHDVVNNIQSVGDDSPSDAPATTLNNHFGGEDAGDGPIAKEDGEFMITDHILKFDEQIIDDNANHSDTDTSRAEGSVAGDGKSLDSRPVKKFSVSKPVSFAKYSVPKVIAANTAKAPVEKAANVLTAPVPTLQALGRPRLVAKTTSSLQQKSKPFKPSNPDPMQVWNKNRATPQPSTKNLTDEELKQQYGIHLTSRLQSDGEGKEAKWADIDDDEDDWAPETIEWGDGTKSTVNPADNLPIVKSTPSPQPAPAPVESIKPVPPPISSTPSFSSSIGPNAVVLKLGQSAERQQAQKASQQAKGPMESSPLPSSQTNPAPAPSRSPWAKLPPVEKVSPVAINPQLAMPPPPLRQPSSGSYPTQTMAAAPSPAKEISADDFNRSWKESSTGQTRELFIPNSGRYETVPENRRRMSRHEQGVRAPAVLLRNGQSDNRMPAEPSAAFQTHRTSTDIGRRRASSNLSGGSGQMARRMSIKSGELPSPLSEDRPGDVSAVMPPAVNQIFKDEPSAPAQNSTYQARSSDNSVGQVATPSDLDVVAQQKALMRERIERAKKRKEEEAKMEAEKQERLKAKLASLGPDPKLAKGKSVEDGQEVQNNAISPTVRQSPVPNGNVQSPPKPPQPLATGEPQQYGMMKVHPMDSIKKNSPPATAQPELEAPLAEVQNMAGVASRQPVDEDISPKVNDVRPVAELQRPGPDASSIPEPIHRNSRPVSAVAEARAGWGRNDHRSPPTSSLWGLPHNKSLGNGTFDQTLAGYAPQDLSSRASSTGQGWLNGKTPVAGQSPQLHGTNSHTPETRSQALQTMTSPSQQPLAVDSEIDTLFPARPTAPIGPPQHQSSAQHLPNGYSPQPLPPTGGIAGWNNFHNVARTQERADNERFQRDMVERKEEEKRTGVRQQAPYHFNETFKQVQPGEQAGQRAVSNVTQISLPPSSIFGAVGSLPLAPVNGHLGRGGSRFFPPSNGGPVQQERRAVTYSHPGPPRSPSPPPAEDYASHHPAFDDEFQPLVVRMPPEKAVVKLPPAMMPTMPPSPPASIELDVPTSNATQPMTWAARLSMPAPKPTPPVRAVSTPLVQHPSWQERFNGLLGKKGSEVHAQDELSQQLEAMSLSEPALAVTSVSKEPLDSVHMEVIAAVSLPQDVSVDESDDGGEVTSKLVEDEEDLFEDREPGSLPTTSFPREIPALQWPRADTIMTASPSVDARSKEPLSLPGSVTPSSKTPVIWVRGPDTAEAIKREMLMKNGATGRPQHRNVSNHHKRGYKATKSRASTKA